MKPIEVRLPEKSKPRVTVGRKATDRRRNGDGWVAEVKQMTCQAAPRHLRLRIPTVEIQMDREWDGTHSFGRSRCELVRLL